MAGTEPHVSSLNQHNYNQGWQGKELGEREMDMDESEGWYLSKEVAKYDGGKCGITQ